MNEVKAMLPATSQKARWEAPEVVDMNTSETQGKAQPSPSETQSTGS